MLKATTWGGHIGILVHRGGGLYVLSLLNMVGSYFITGLVYTFICNVFSFTPARPLFWLLAYAARGRWRCRMATSR